MTRYSFNNVYDDFFRQCNSLCEDNAAVWCCLAIDVKHFKIYNDIYGREKGDELLSAFSVILEDFCEKNEGCYAHFGKDDFAVFTHYNHDRIEKLQRQLETRIHSNITSVGFTPIIGLYMLASDEPIDFRMYDHAYAAVCDAANTPDATIVHFDPSTLNEERREHELLVRLDDAYRRGVITFYLQPQCRMSNRRIVGAEVLARWIEPDGSMIPPGLFIPVLEKHRFIADFDKIIWDKACAWLRSVIDRGIKPVPISVNVSQYDLTSMDVPAYMTELCDRYNLPPELLHVEITESAYATDLDYVYNIVDDLRHRGFVTLMDDFGSGYSSLNMLEHISIDILKLDMAFIRKTNFGSRKGITILESIVNMSKMMGLPTIVEGVETAEQVKSLQNMGCRYAQGFYFYKPMNVIDFEDLLLDDSIIEHDPVTAKANEQVHVREFLDENSFTDTLLNNLLGAVAFYALEDTNLTITRFNEQFYEMIADAKMDRRQSAIQNYVVRDDWPALYKALDDAYSNVANGGTCEIRFYKSDNSVFWFHMHFYYLRNEQDRKIFFGQIEDVTELREQSMQLFEVLRKQSELAMTINLEQKKVQYVRNNLALSQIGLPSIDLDSSIELTISNRIRLPEDKQKFRDFFNAERLKAAHAQAKYHESMRIEFKLYDEYIPVEFCTYYIRYRRDAELQVYIFISKVTE